MKNQFVLSMLAVGVFLSVGFTARAQRTGGGIKIGKSVPIEQKPNGQKKSDRDKISVSSKESPKSNDDKKVISSSLFSNGIGKTVQKMVIPIPDNDIVKQKTFADKSKLTTRVIFGGSLRSDVSQMLGRSSVGGKQKGKSERAAGDEWTDCVTTPVKASMEDDSFMNVYNESKNTYLLPGSVFTFENFFNGSMQPEKANRNPIRIATTSKTKGVPYEIIENPTRIDIMTAKNALANRTPISKKVGSYKGKVYEVSSEAESIISVSAGASGFGAKIFGAISSERQSNERHLLIDVTQEMFSIIAEIPENGVFVNPEDAKKHGLMFLSSVTYGFRALVSLKIKINSYQDAVNFNASYGGGMGYGAELDLESIQKGLGNNTEVKMYIVGGKNTGFLSTDRNQIISKLNEALQEITTENAAPIYIDFQNMNGKQIKTVNVTDTFSPIDCVPKPPKDKKRVYDVEIDLKQLTYKEGDKMEEKIGFDVFAELFVGNQSKGRVRLMCRNKEGNNGCKSVQKMMKGSSSSYTGASNIWKLGMSEEDLQNSKIVLGTSYLGFYEKGIYSDQLQRNYGRSTNMELKKMRKSMENTREPNMLKLQADIRSNEAEFDAQVFVLGRDVDVN